MMGGMLAGHDQCSGEVIEKNGKKYKLFYGMSSDTAMKKYVGGVAEYRWDILFILHLEINMHLRGFILIRCLWFLLIYVPFLDMKVIPKSSAWTRKYLTLSSPLCSQGVWGEDSGSSLQRRCGEHHPGCAGGAPLHLHLRGRRQAERAEQENHLHPGHTTVQPNVHLAGS